MTERPRSPRRGRKTAAADPTSAPTSDTTAEVNPYREAPEASAAASEERTKPVRPTRGRGVRGRAAAADAPDIAEQSAPAEPVARVARVGRPKRAERTEQSEPASPPPPPAFEALPPSNMPSMETSAPVESSGFTQDFTPRNDRGDRNDTDSFDDQRHPGPRRHRNRRFRNKNRNQQGGPQGGHQQGGHTGGQQQQGHQQHGNYGHQNNAHHNNGNNQFAGNRRHRQHRKFDNAPRGPIGPITPEGESTGWFDMQRDAGYIRFGVNSYLADANDPMIPTPLARQYGLRRGDLIVAAIGRDQRNRLVATEILSVNGCDPAEALRRPDFQSLVASYPERKLTLETGKPAKGGPELTRRAIDLIAPIGFGQRALIVAPARAGKTMLLQAVIEGVAINQPEAALFVLLVDERPEEVSDMMMLGYGEVIASSFDMPAARHTDVAEMTLERARRLVELGKDVVIVLDSITRLARAYNTVERGTGRTLSGGLDSSAMAKPKAFFGSARSVSEQHGGGSLTIIATALVETGSRMDDVIFEEFKGTGNCEIKLDRSLAEKRIFPAIDIGVSGTRREDKLFRPDQLDNVYTLRRGLQQMPPSSAMEWLIKRIAGTTGNEPLLSGL